MFVACLSSLGVKNSKHEHLLFTYFLEKRNALFIILIIRTVVICLLLTVSIVVLVLGLGLGLSLEILVLFTLT